MRGTLKKFVTGSNDPVPSISAFVIDMIEVHFWRRVYLGYRPLTCINVLSMAMTGKN